MNGGKTLKHAPFHLTQKNAHGKIFQKPLNQNSTQLRTFLLSGF